MKASNVEEYILRAQPFAQPILMHLRALVHQACPEVQEEIKWGFPNFGYKGMFCSMAAFKAHCAFGFWKEAAMTDPHGILEHAKDGMGALGKIRDLSDLPADEILLQYLLQAMALNDAGIGSPKKSRSRLTEPIAIPNDFLDLLNTMPEVCSNFMAMPRSHQKEYVVWFDEAKRPETRTKRMLQALEMIEAGKSRNWKYEAK